MNFKLFPSALSVALWVVMIPQPKPATNNYHNYYSFHYSNNVIAAQNHFAFKLFKATLKNDNTTANTLISPLSIYFNLSMVYNGTFGETKLKMQQAMQLDNADTSLLNLTNGTLIGYLSTTDSAVETSIANAIWYRDQGQQPLPAFLKVNSVYYHAKVTGSDFNNPNTVNQINHWVSDQTHQKITSIVEQIPHQDILYLINAVYFNGKWENAFDTNRINRKRFFHLADGDSVRTDFMFKRSRFNYMQNQSLQIIEIPYGKGDFNMFVLLPSKISNLQTLIPALNEDSLNRYISSLDSVVVDLRLPSWEYRCKTNMKRELTAMGMGIAFGPKANFSKMYSSNANTEISQVLQETYIKVNARGTEAAAATTSVTIGYTAPAHFKPPPVMDVNQPFFYIISEKKTGAILFIGEVNNPKEGQGLSSRG
jgi:serpin B